MTLKEIYEKYSNEVVESGTPLILQSPNVKLFDLFLVRFKRSSHVKAYFKVIEKKPARNCTFVPKYGVINGK